MFEDGLWGVLLRERQQHYCKHVLRWNIVSTRRSLAFWLFAKSLHSSPFVPCANRSRGVLQSSRIAQNDVVQNGENDSKNRRKPASEWVNLVAEDRNGTSWASSYSSPGCASRPFLDPVTWEETLNVTMISTNGHQCQPFAIVNQHHSPNSCGLLGQLAHYWSHIRHHCWPVLTNIWSLQAIICQQVARYEPLNSYHWCGISLSLLSIIRREIRLMVNHHHPWPWFRILLVLITPKYC